mgnify:CR=1 FL=1
MLVRTAAHFKAKGIRSYYKILVVEDNPVFERQVVRALSHLSMNSDVEVCHTGAEAFELLQNEDVRFDLALVDLGLPDVSGIEVIQALRKRLGDVPVMVISVIKSESTVLSAIRAGARGYILKGESETELARAIEDVLGGNYPISPSLARSLFKLAGAPAASNGGANDFDLSPRELETLSLMAEGRSNSAIAAGLHISESAVAKNVNNIFTKFDLSPADTDHRRVLAVLQFINK